MGKGARTKAAILTAAEGLFAEHGYDGVTLRDIAAAAEVRLALIDYHFGAKEMLLEAVVAPRAEALSAVRRGALAVLAAERRRPSVEAVLDAYMLPYLQAMGTGEMGMRLAGQLIAQIRQKERWAALMARHFDDTVRLCIDQTMRALPGLDRESATRGFIHAIAVMTAIFVPNRRLDTISRGVHSGEDLARAYPIMRTFAAGGLRALAVPTRPAPAPKRKRRAPDP